MHFLLQILSFLLEGRVRVAQRKSSSGRVPENNSGTCSTTTTMYLYGFIFQVYHKHWLDSPWSGFFEGKDPLKAGEVGVHEETLTHIGKRFSAGPPNAQDFLIHKAMTRILKSRLEMVNNRTVGKKHALKKYDQFALNTSCFWGSIGLNNLTREKLNF